MKTLSFSHIWSDALRRAIDRASIKPYPMELHAPSADYAAVAKAINQGIDSHLEAIRFTQSPGSHGRTRIVLEPQSVSVLVRRLMESGEDNAESLASSICDTLDIELI